MYSARNPPFPSPISTCSHESIIRARILVAEDLKARIPPIHLYRATGESVRHVDHQLLIGLVLTSIDKRSLV